MKLPTSIQNFQEMRKFGLPLLPIAISVFTGDCFTTSCQRIHFIPDDVQEDIDNLLENVPEIKEAFTVLNKIGSGK